MSSVESLASIRALVEDQLVQILLPAAAGGPVGATILAELAQAHLATGGKRLRGTLPAALVSAGGGDLPGACLFGACVEAVHNGTLVHDDIQDGDALRRGKPTLWKTHGMPQAINAGDAMLVGPLLALLRSDLYAPAVAADLSRLLGEALLETICGQIADVAFHSEAAPDLAKAAAIAGAKTVPLFRCAFEGSVVLLGGTDAQRKAARQLGDHVGLAFQVRDDLLDALGVKGRGAAGADLREGKPTWPMLAALRNGPPEQAASLQSLLHRAAAGARVSDEEVATWTDWVEEHGGVQAARLAVEAALTRARACAEAAFDGAGAAIVHDFCLRLAHLDG